MSIKNYHHRLNANTRLLIWHLLVLEHSIVSPQVLLILLTLLILLGWHVVGLAVGLMDDDLLVREKVSLFSKEKGGGGSPHPLHHTGLWLFL